MAHDIRALPASTSSAPDPADGPPPASDPHRTCRHCGRSLTSSDQATWHTTTGTVSCSPVLDADGGWAEPDPVVPPAAVTLTPDLMVAVAAARARDAQDPAEIVTVRLHRQDAEVLYGVVGEQLPGHDAAGTNALLALGIQLRRQLGGAS